MTFLYLPITVFYGHVAFFSNFSTHHKLLIPTKLDQYIDKPYDRDEHSYAENLDAVCKVPKLSVLNPEIENILIAQHIDPTKYICENVMPSLFKIEGSFLTPQDDPRKYEFVVTNVSKEEHQMKILPSELVKTKHVFYLSASLTYQFF